MEQQQINGAVRIGRGAKLHPASKREGYGLIIRCSCPGTQQGGAYNRAKFFTGMQANCKN